MTQLMYSSLQHAFIWLLQDILDHGQEVDVRGNKTKEFTHLAFKVTNGKGRVMNVPHRNNDIFAQVAETLWVLAGRNDIGFLSYYLPRAADFSDDGKTWRAGYGPRLRAWPKYQVVESAHEDSFNHGGLYRERVDQIAEVVNLLRNDPHTRQATISIWDPAEDWVDNSKDIPCTNWLHFLQRDGKLDLEVVMRSNDILWGFSGINFFEWSVLLDMMAFWTKFEVGAIHWFASSFHLYERHFDRSKKIVESYTMDFYTGRAKDAYSQGFKSPKFTVPFAGFNRILNYTLQAAKALQHKDEALQYKDWGSYEWIEGYINESLPTDDEFFPACLTMLRLYAYYRGHLAGFGNSIWLLREELEAMPSWDLKIGALEFFRRKLKDVDLPMTTAEREFFEPSEAMAR